jgi:hypothetical protein
MIIMQKFVLLLNTKKCSFTSNLMGNMLVRYINTVKSLTCVELTCSRIV